MSGLRNDAAASELNSSSYSLVDLSMWLGNGPMINNWRRTDLNLPPVRLGTFGGNLLPRFRVPFSFLWSPAFVPKPEDWGDHVEVVGVFHPPASGAGGGFDTAPFAALVHWLAQGKPPIFIGFGSMVVADVNALSAMIVEASKLCGLRVLVQSNWSKLTTADGSNGMCFDIGPVRAFRPCAP